MADEVLTAEKILDKAVEVLRRFGPDKTTVVDVARALGVSHGSVYRHFPSKAALRDAVTARWLAEVMQPLELIVEQEGTATEKLRSWLQTLHETKRKRALDDPELFATYMKLVEEAREVVRQHVEHLIAHLTRIVTDGVAQGEFAVANQALTARAVLDATNRFHNPAHAADWTDPEIDITAAFEAVFNLIIAGLATRPA